MTKFTIKMEYPYSIVKTDCEKRGDDIVGVYRIWKGWAFVGEWLPKKFYSYFEAMEYAVANGLAKMEQD